MIITVCDKNIDVAQHSEFSFYACSDDGRVFTRPAVKERRGLPRNGHFPREDHWVEISQFILKAKYTPPYKKCRVTQEGKTKIVSVHRFMLECWDCVQPRTVITRHLDGDSLNNNLSNLKYGTVQENVNDTFKHTGNYAEGKNNGRAKLSESDVLAIRKRHAAGESPRGIYADYPFISFTAFGCVIKRQTWKHL